MPLKTYKLMQEGEPTEAGRDLAALVVERCRDAFRSVSQLVEDDEECAGLAMTISIDMLNGAVTMLRRTAKYEKQSRAEVARFALAGVMQIVLDDDDLKPKYRNKTVSEKRH